MKTAYISHPNCVQHNMGASHAEAPERVTAIHTSLTEAGVLDNLLSYEAPLVAREQLLAAHTEEHVARIFELSPQQGFATIDADTSMNPHSLEAAMRAAGAVVKAVELVLSGDAHHVFCNVRPPGHHAERNKAMGFCLFNSIAVGVYQALTVSDVDRVAVLDFDVHHGNGTEDIFNDEPRVLLCQTYQSPLYPYSGQKSVAGHVVNVPLSYGAGEAEFRSAVNDHWLPELRAFNPDIIFISAGFDAHQDDPLAQLSFTEDDYAWVTQEIVAVANQCCPGRIVSSLEGGYNLEALGRCSLAHVLALMPS